MKENRIVFLPVPESLKRDGVFAVNPDIPVPVEIPEDAAGEKPCLDELSGEMILSAMLRVIEAGKEKQEWIDYYRRFVLVLRPGILAEFTDAAIVKARNGDFDTALDILSCLHGLFPVSPVVNLNRALVLEEQAAQCRKSGKKDEARVSAAAAAAYGELLNLRPPFPQALFNGGYFFLSQNDFQKAAECFSRYIDIAQDDDKRELAEGALKEIRDNGLDDERFGQARVLIEQGRLEEGLSCIREFLERRPLVWNGWFMLGWVLRLLGRWKDGEAAFRKAIELGGGGDTRNELAICLMETGDASGAQRELEAALAEDPENVKIISNLGVLAMKSGDREKAAAFFRTALELDSDDPVAGKWAREYTTLTKNYNNNTLDKKIKRKK